MLALLLLMPAAGEGTASYEPAACRASQPKVPYLTVHARAAAGGGRPAGQQASTAVPCWSAGLCEGGREV